MSAARPMAYVTCAVCPLVIKRATGLPLCPPHMKVAYRAFAAEQRGQPLGLRIRAWNTTFQDAEAVSALVRRDLAGAS